MGSLREQPDAAALQRRVEMLRDLEHRLADDPHVRPAVLGVVREMLMEAEAASGKDV